MPLTLPASGLSTSFSSHHNYGITTSFHYSCRFQLVHHKISHVCVNARPRLFHLFVHRLLFPPSFMHAILLPVTPPISSSILPLDLPLATSASWHRPVTSTKAIRERRQPRSTISVPVVQERILRMRSASATTASSSISPVFLVPGLHGPHCAACSIVVKEWIRPGRHWCWCHDLWHHHRRCRRRAGLVGSTPLTRLH